MIDVINLKKSFGSHDVLNGIDITINKGDIVVVIGPSGSGKSTFLRCLNCMEDPTGGQIIFNDVDIADPHVDINVHRRHMGMVFQHFNLFNNKTVLENIMLAPVHVHCKGLHGAKRKEEVKKIREQAMGLLARINMQDKADVYPSTLSGGQKQRVAVARAIITNPDLILADEPTGALDSKSTEELLHLFGTINENQQTIVMVTHSTKAASHASRVLFIKDGKIFHEIYNGNKNLDQMYQCISDTLTLLATGGVHHE